MFSIPNILTLANLLLGCMAIWFSLHGNFTLTYYCFLGSLLADLLDGLVARMLNQSSPIGAQLDSLADMVSFGLSPAIICVLLLNEYSLNQEFTYVRFIGFVLSAFAALRLAKFNVDLEQSVDFKGLNTPAAACFVFGWHWIWSNGCFDSLTNISSIWPHIIVVVALSVLMVSNIPMLSLKPIFSDKKRTRNQLTLVIGAAILFVFFKLCAISLVILWYLLYSILLYFLKKNSKT